MEVKLLDLTLQYQQIRDEVRPVVESICDSQQFILGARTEAFEARLAEYCQTKHAIGVSSGSSALLLAMMAMNIKPGDEVICPSFTFFATAGSIARLGAKPVFVDIEPGTFNIDAKEIAKRVTPKTRAIMPVHLFGQVADMGAINAIAASHGLSVVEDAAQAIGAEQGGKRACSMGTVGCLSFFPSKNLGAFGDAGAICTNDDNLAARCRMLRVHGGTRQYFHDEVGGNFRIDALQAGILEVKLRHLEAWHAGRQRNAALYNSLLAGSKVVTPPVLPGNRMIYNQYVVRVPNRDAVKDRLAKKGVGSAIYYPLGLHEQKCFASLGYKHGDLPHTERACAEVLALPIYPELREEQVRFAAAALLEAVSE